MCSPIFNDDTNLSSQLKLLTEYRLCSCQFLRGDILKTINNLDSHKAHGHNMIIIRVFKVCSAFFCKSLDIICETWLESGKFPSKKLRSS